MRSLRPTSRSKFRRAVALLLVACLLPSGSALALAGCGNDQKASKTEIAARLALAYGAFKRYVYTPAQEGKFKKGADGRVAAIAKAGVAGAFSARMLQKAKEEADQSPTLKPYSGKIVAAAASIGGLTAVLKGGDALSLPQLTGGLGSLDSLVAAGKDLGIDTDTAKSVSATDLLKG